MRKMVVGEFFQIMTYPSVNAQWLLFVYGSAVRWVIVVMETVWSVTVYSQDCLRYLCCSVGICRMVVKGQSVEYLSQCANWLYTLWSVTIALP